MKTCSVCKREKPTAEFIKANKSKKTGKLYGDGRKSICKTCALTRWRKWLAAMPPEKQRTVLAERAQYQKRWSQRRPFYHKAAKANLHARRVGASGVVSEHDVETAWQEWQGLCWCCGRDSSEVDHFRPINKGGGGTNTADNLRPICRECNQKRSHKWHGATVAKKEAKLLKALKELLA